MKLFGKKDEDEDLELPEDDLLSEIEKETSSLSAIPPIKSPPPPLHNMPAPHAPPAPSTPKPPVPASHPAAPTVTPVVGVRREASLTEKEVSNLPLFMKVENYDQIVKQLNTIATSLIEMDEILTGIENLQKEELEESDKWRNHLGVLGRQINKLLNEMPETGRVKEMLEDRKKTKRARSMRSDAKKLKKVVEEEEEEAVKSDVSKLKKSMTDLQGSINTIASGLEAIKKAKPPAPPAPKKPVYKKAKAKNPWD